MFRLSGTLKQEHFLILILNLYECSANHLPQLVGNCLTELDECHLKSADKHNFSSLSSVVMGRKKSGNVTTAANAMYCSTVTEMKRRNG